MHHPLKNHKHSWYISSRAAAMSDFFTFYCHLPPFFSIINFFTFYDADMAPGSRWKSSVNDLNQGFDNVRRHIDTLTKMDDMKKTVYSNPTTQVDIVVKSKKPKNQESWSSILSSGNQEKQASNSRPLRKKATKKAIKDQVDSKKQAQPVQQPSASQHKFSSRTLQIFLKEMRLALKQENAKIQVEKILDDLEYVAANLDPEQPLNSEGQRQPNYDLSLHKAELKKSKSDNEVLKRNVLILENKVHELEHQLKANVKKVSQYKTYVSELSSNGNEMLNLLHSKAASKEDVDDKVASLEKSNFKLQKELSQERLKTSSLELKLKKVDFENSKLKKVIEYVVHFYLLSNPYIFLCFRTLKTTGMQNLQNFDKVVTKDPMELETGPEEDTPLSLEISSDKSSEVDPDHGDNSARDSAIGVSEALQTASAAAPLVVPEMSFRPLDLSETRSSTSQSSNWSQNESKDEIRKSNEAEEMPVKEDKKADLMANVGAKVNDYLNKIEQLRTDKRFQISLASLEQSRDLPGDSTKMSFNTDLDSTTLTETKFRQGLESSIDISEDQEFSNKK